MLQFILSCVLLLSIVLWWAEAKYNFIYGRIMWLKDVCNWVKRQTKLKIDICKWFLPCIFIIGVVYTLYYPYFKQTLEFKQGAFVIRGYSEEGRDDKGRVSKQATENIENKEKTNPIGEWGTFGDFVGGTLNPIIGLISIFLLFLTWKLTSDSFKSTDSALKLQQFDSWFFNLLQSFQSINYKYDEKVINDRLYQKLFIEKEQNLALSQDTLLFQYFSSLTILLKMIETKLSFIDSRNDQKDLKDFYIETVISHISGEVLQILAWYGFHDKVFKKLMEDTGFFRTLNFDYYVDGRKRIFRNYNFEILSHFHRYDEKIFHESASYLEIKNSYLYEIFFGSEPFVYAFFRKQYVKEITLIVKTELIGENQINITFDEKGMNYFIYNEQNKRCEKYSIEYKTMDFTNYTIIAKINNNFGFLIPEGNISKLKMSNSEIYRLVDLKVN